MVFRVLTLNGAACWETQLKTFTMYCNGKSLRAFRLATHSGGIATCCAGRKSAHDELSPFGPGSFRSCESKKIDAPKTAKLSWHKDVATCSPLRQFCPGCTSGLATTSWDWDPTSLSVENTTGVFLNVLVLARTLDTATTNW